MNGAIERAEGALQLERVLPFPAGPGYGNQGLFHQFASRLAGEPTEAYGHRGLRSAILVAEPGFLTNALRRIFVPEIEAFNTLVGKPDRAMMIVIRGARVAHTREGHAGRTNEWIKERPRILGAKMPAP